MTTTVEAPAISPAEQVAAQVRAELARVRLSGRELGRRTGVDYQYWQRRLSGVTPFNVVDLATIADLLGVPVSTLIAPLDSPGKGRDPMVECGPAAGHEDVSRADLGLAA